MRQESLCLVVKSVKDSLPFDASMRNLRNVVDLQKQQKSVKFDFKKRRAADSKRRSLETPERKWARLDAQIERDHLKKGSKVREHVNKVAELRRLRQERLQRQRVCNHLQSRQTPVDPLRQFHEELSSISECSSCYELSATLNSSHECKQCSGDKSLPKLYSSSNSMDLGSIPLTIKSIKSRCSVISDVQSKIIPTNQHGKFHNTQSMTVSQRLAPQMFYIRLVFTEWLRPQRGWMLFIIIWRRWSRAYQWSLPPTPNHWYTDYWYRYSKAKREGVFIVEWTSAHRRGVIP